MAAPRTKKKAASRPRASSGSDAGVVFSPDEMRRYRDQLTRKMDEALRAFDASGSSRLRSEVARLFGSGASVVEPDRWSLVAVSRAMDRNSPIYNAFMDRMVVLLIGSGLKPRGTTAAARRALDLFEEWWAVDADHAGMSDGDELQYFWTRDVCVTGDVLPMRVGGGDRAGTIQTVESERLGGWMGRHTTDGGNEVLDGVETDESGRVLAFHVSPWGLYEQTVDTTKSERVEARHAHLLSNRQRHSQIRGTPWMTAAMEKIAQHEDYLTMQAVAATIAASFAIVVKSMNPVGTGGALTRGGGAQTVTASDGTTSTQELTPAMAGRVVTLRPGEDITPVQGAHPQNNLESYHGAMQRIFAGVAGFPVESVMMDLSKANYSTARMAAHFASQSAGPYRGQLKSRVLTPVYRWWRAGAIMRGEIPDDPGSLRVTWTDPAPISADPLRDLQAMALALDKRLATYAELLLEKNTTPDEVHRTLAEEFDLLEELGIAPVNAPGTEMVGSAPGSKPADGGEPGEQEDTGGASPR